MSNVTNSKSRRLIEKTLNIFDESTDTASSSSNLRTYEAVLRQLNLREMSLINLTHCSPQFSAGTAIFHTIRK